MRKDFPQVGAVGFEPGDAFEERGRRRGNLGSAVRQDRFANLLSDVRGAWTAVAFSGGHRSVVEMAGIPAEPLGESQESPGSGWGTVL